MAPHSKRKLMFSATQMSTIEHLVLLDLLGNSRPRISSYFLSTAWLFDSLASAESRLGQSGAFDDADHWDSKDSFFVRRTGQEHNVGYIADDHVPFLQRGVNILHVIASPFPRVWHTLKVTCLLPHGIRSEMLIIHTIGRRVCIRFGDIKTMESHF
jgi:glutaminyl-peptide cyclotransferase